MKPEGLEKKLKTRTSKGFEIDETRLVSFEKYQKIRNET
jgi:hypothetical protein